MPKKSTQTDVYQTIFTTFLSEVETTTNSDIFSLFDGEEFKTFVSSFVKKHKNMFKTLSKGEEGEEEKEGKTKKTKKEKDPNAPKRPMSSYFLYCNEMREKVKKDNPEMSTKEIATELGRRWAEEDEKTKNHYQELATEEKVKYEEKMKDYKPLPREGCESEESKKKRTPSGYILFCKDHREEAKKKQPNMKPKEVTAELGRLWQEADQKTKDKYNQKSSDVRGLSSSSEESTKKDKKKTETVVVKDAEDDSDFGNENEEEKKPTKGKKKGGKK